MDAVVVSGMVTVYLSELLPLMFGFERFTVTFLAVPTLSVSNTPLRSAIVMESPATNSLFGTTAVTVTVLSPAA